MNEAAVILMLVTSTGIQSGPSFQSFEECEAVSANITKHETFCHYQAPVDMDAAIDRMGDILKRMAEKLNEVKNNKDTTPAL